VLLPVNHEKKTRNAARNVSDLVGNKSGVFQKTSPKRQQSATKKLSFPSVVI
jgi:hypothetical protein